MVLGKLRCIPCQASHVITTASDAEFNPNGMLVQRYREASLDPMCEGSGLRGSLGVLEERGNSEPEAKMTSLF
jgi:hypothetical protein